jgi:hypothetical protein
MRAGVGDRLNAVRISRSWIQPYQLTEEGQRMTPWHLQKEPGDQYAAACGVTYSEDLWVIEIAGMRPRSHLKICPECWQIAAGKDP